MWDPVHIAERLRDHYAGRPNAHLAHEGQTLAGQMMGARRGGRRNADLWYTSRRIKHDGRLRLRRAIAGAMIGLLYGSILAFLSIVAAGGGHGTIVPLLLSSAPLSVFLYAPSGVSEAMSIRRTTQEEQSKAPPQFQRVRNL